MIGQNMKLNKIVKFIIGFFIPIVVVGFALVVSNYPGISLGLVFLAICIGSGLLCIKKPSEGGYGCY